jgi:hypothetical protein
MARFQLPGIDSLRLTDKRLYTSLKAVEQAINNHSDQGNMDPMTTAPAPPQPISNISVTENGGIHDIQITDHSPAYAGINYTADYSQTPDFANFHTIDMGVSQNHRANLGPGQYYWRGSSFYHPSAPSVPVLHGGGSPVAVGSGAYTGPAMQPKQGFTGLYRNSTVPPIRK